MRKHFNASPPSLNKQLPTRTNKEYARGPKNKEAQRVYREEHADKIHKDQAAHYQRNRDKLLMKRREYLALNRDKINTNARNLRARKKKRLG